MSIARLISITPKAEELITYCARVSNPTNQELNPDSERLVKYLIKHNHWSPFEMAHMVIEINTTRAVAAQILRHRSFSFQEFSQRYADVSLMDFASAPQLRRQDTKNRQNSIDDLDDDLITNYTSEVEELYKASESLYKRLLADGVAKECARDILPLGTPTRLYMSGTIRSWIHYIKLRAGNGTQLEHQQIAVAIGEIVKQELPNIYSASLS